MASLLDRATHRCLYRRRFVDCPSHPTACSTHNANRSSRSGSVLSSTHPGRRQCSRSVEVGPALRIRRRTVTELKRRPGIESIEDCSRGSCGCWTTCRSFHQHGPSTSEPAESLLRTSLHDCRESSSHYQ